MFYKQKIIISEWFLKEHVTLKTGVMMLKIHQRNRWYFKIHYNGKQCNCHSKNISALIISHRAGYYPYSTKSYITKWHYDVTSEHHTVAGRNEASSPRQVRRRWRWISKQPAACCPVISRTPLLNTSQTATRSCKWGWIVSKTLQYKIRRRFNESLRNILIILLIMYLISSKSISKMMDKLTFVVLMCETKKCSLYSLTSIKVQSYNKNAWFCDVYI